MSFRSCPERRCSSRFIWGLIALGAGVLLFAFNAGFLPSAYKSIVFSWPVALIILGSVMAFQRAVVGGVVLLSIGAYLLSGRLGFPIYEIKKIVLPALLVFLGFALLRKSRQYTPVKMESGNSKANGRILEHNFFGGSRQQFGEEPFLGGEIHCLFGGSELDLTRASLPEGLTELEIRCLFGGVTLIIPSSWNVQIQTQALFGGFVEEEHPPRTIADTSRTLLIRGSCIIGGGEIRYRDI